MAKPDDLVGKRFGLFTVMSAHSSRNGKARWLCRCDCGVEKDVQGGNLKSGASTNCGCRQSAIRRSAPVTHGQTNTKLYRIWRGILWRCQHPKSEAYHLYGGRGITVCDRWKSFENFLADMGERPDESYSIERRDNDGNYDPGNCYWATPAEQARNRSTSHKVTFGEETLTLAEWSRKAGISESTLRRRMAVGWPIERAITQRPR